jgi:hypothetical protein
MGRICEDDKTIIIRTLETVINTLDTITVTFGVVMERQIKLEDRVQQLKKALAEAENRATDSLVIPTKESEENIHCMTRYSLVVLTMLFMMIYMLHESDMFVLH